MSPRALSEPVQREVELLRRDQPVREAVRKIIDSGLPALPVVDDSDKFVGIFGEREFIQAAFPGYLGQLKYAAMVKRSVEEGIEKRKECLVDPVEKYMNTEHIDVDADYSDVQVGEIFLHHRVLIVPVTEGGRVVGVVTRSDFFRVLVEKLAG